MNTEFYRRPLPTDLIGFASETGRQIFREALAEGNMEGYFAIAEQYHTQAEPAFCGLGSLVVALNAMAIDPGRLWQGPWRWFDETMLDCCVPFDRIRERGITLHEFSCLARCNGATAELHNAGTAASPPPPASTSTASDAALQAFRNQVAHTMAHADSGIVVVAYSRQALGQTGDGHFSPIGGYNAQRDQMLIMDVARFKYSPHWVNTADLFRAMTAIDATTQRPRGWILLRRAPGGRPMMLRLFAAKNLGSIALTALVEELEQALPTAQTVADVVDIFAKLAPTFWDTIGTFHDGPHLPTEHASEVQALLAGLAASPMAALVKTSRVAPELQPLIALLLLALPERALTSASLSLQTAFATARHIAATDDGLRREVAALSQQLAVVWCGPASCA